MTPTDPKQPETKKREERIHTTSLCIRENVWTRGKRKRRGRRGDSNWNSRASCAPFLRFSSSDHLDRCFDVRWDTIVSPGDHQSMLPATFFSSVSHSPLLAVFVFVLLPSLSLGTLVRANDTETLNSHVRHSSGDIHATWIPVTWLHLTRENIVSVWKNLSAIGVNRVYLDVWNDGKVHFASPTMKSFVGDEGIGLDVLSWALEAGNMFSIETIAWFQYGLISMYGNQSNAFSLEALRRGWVLGVDGGFTWLNPSILEVSDFLGGLLRDACILYSSRGLSGVQLDDHFSTPSEFGISIDVMTNAMRHVRSFVPTSSSGALSSCILSLAPSPLNFSITHYHADWLAWSQELLVDELIPQLYRANASDFVSIFDETDSLLSSTEQHLWTITGVRVDGSGSPTLWNEVAKMIDYNFSHHRGASIWYAHGIVDIYPTEFKELWSRSLSKATHGS